jgi:hypothetical protein
MRHAFSILALLAVVGLVCLPARAQLNTLYEQEGTGSDGYAPIDASGQAPGANPNSTNWIWQTGSYSWSGVYSWDSNAWVEEQESGDPQMDIECDIEMYCEETLENNKVYFHVGNLYTALQNPGTDLTAYVTGTLTSNNGQYIGISFDGTTKAGSPETYFEGYPDALTGRIFNGMVGTLDCGGRDISTEAFDITITLSYTGTGSSGGYVAPGDYGEGAHGTIPNALWWLLNNGVPGAYNLSWKIQLHPGAHQPDGNYNLDPTIVAAPIL